MSLRPFSEIRNVSGITDKEKYAIKHFMQGAVYCWLKNRSDEEFKVRDLMGGENLEWEGTPLQALYQKHIDQNKTYEQAFNSAAIDLGWLVKSVLHDDKRTFEVIDSDFVATYKWVGGEP